MTVLTSIPGGADGPVASLEKVAALQFSAVKLFAGLTEAQKEKRVRDDINALYSTLHIALAISGPR